MLDYVKIIQILRLRKIMSSYKPSMHLGSVAEIDPVLVSTLYPELQAVAFDIDKTLLGQHEAIIPERNMEALLALSSLGLRIGIISNAVTQEREDRVIKLSFDIGYSIGAKVEYVTAFMVGGQRKPARPIFDELSNRFKIPNREICYVGDQLFKDIHGANKAGYGATILVAPYGEGDHPGVKYLQRPAESLVRPFVGLPFLARNIGRKRI